MYYWIENEKIKLVKIMHKFRTLVASEQGPKELSDESTE